MFKNKKIASILTFIVMALVIIVPLLFVLNGRNTSTDKTNSDSLSENQTSQDVGEPVSSEDKANAKVTIIEKDAASSSSSGEKTQIVPTVVYAAVFGENLEISSYAPVVENAGTCTATVTNISSGATTTAKSTSTPGASTTNCDSLVIPVSKLGSGSLIVKVTYLSENSEGSSQPVELTIQ